MKRNIVRDYRTAGCADLATLRQAVRIAYGQLEPEFLNGETKRKLTRFVLDSAKLGFAETQALARMALDQLTLASMQEVRRQRQV